MNACAFGGRPLVAALSVFMLCCRPAAAAGDPVRGGYLFAAAGCAGIMVQFPLYAGIMGIMVASGLVQMLTSGMLALATPETLEFWTMVSAGVVNLLVPSGGGQWAVQGPIALSVALGAIRGRIAVLGTAPANLPRISQGTPGVMVIMIVY